MILPFILLSIMTMAIPAYGLELPLDPKEAGRAIYLHQDKMDKNFGDQTAMAEMVLINRAGQESIRKFTIQTMEELQDGDKSLITFSSPRDIRGTTLLTYEHIEGNDDQWIYLPSLKRVKRITSANKSGSFVGSEFSYEDISSNVVAKYTYQYIRADSLDNIKCWVVERYPVDKYSGYSKQITWIDQSNTQPLKIEYFDRKGTLLKTSIFSDYKEYDKNIWRAHKIVMSNIQTGKKTILTLDKYEIGTGLSRKVFSKGSLGRRR